jgi:hypothetical protein
LDDVTIDVRFDATAAGTVVRLEATVSEGGADRGGSSFVRVAPTSRDVAGASRKLARPSPASHRQRVGGSPKAGK